MVTFDIVIVGAGLAGLYCGIQLAKKGKSVCILEKYNYTGGRVVTYHKGGLSWEIGAGRILMAKNGTDGVYDKDPRTHKDAKKYVEISHQDVLELNLGVMDSTAAALCKDNGIEIIVFDMNQPGNIMRAVAGEAVGTRIY